MVKRTSHRLQHDPRRVIAKPYLPGEEIFTDTGTRAGLLMARILALPEEEVTHVLSETVDRFGGRHRNFEALLERHFAMVAHRVADVTLLKSVFRGNWKSWSHCTRTTRAPVAAA